MIIGIDIRVLAKGARTGVEDYTINLLSHLIPLDKSTKYRLFYNGFRKPNLKYPWLKLPNVKTKKFRIPNRIFDLILTIIKFPKIDKLLKGVDVFLSPHFLITPLSRKTKRIMVFYDLSFLRFPEFFSRPKRLWHKFMRAKRQARNTDAIVAISESTRQDLIDFYGINPSKIKVIYPGIDGKFKIIEDGQKLLEVSRKYNLPVSPSGEPGKFILYFGTIEPRKNILGLIKAFENIKKEKSGKILEVDWRGFEGFVRGRKEKAFDYSQLKLVIAGTRGWLDNNVFETARKSEFKDDIIFTGFINEDDKPYLYNLAEIFVYPSFFEGFGLPPLEAMACGVPTIVSHKSSLPEVVGDAAIMIDPQNIDELAFTIKEVLENRELNGCLEKRGIERAKQFNWDNTAKQFLELFKTSTYAEASADKYANRD